MLTRAHLFQKWAAGQVGSKSLGLAPDRCKLPFRKKTTKIGGKAIVEKLDGI
jgi:hypothetical protein